MICLLKGSIAAGDCGVTKSSCLSLLPSSPVHFCQAWLHSYAEVARDTFGTHMRARVSALLIMPSGSWLWKKLGAD